MTGKGTMICVNLRLRTDLDDGGLKGVRAALTEVMVPTASYLELCRKSISYTP